MCGFCRNNAPYSAILSFTMFIFLLNHFNTWDCYFFESSLSLVCHIKILLIKKKKCFLKRSKHDEIIVCSCHVTYAFQSESTLCSCLNVKELLARSRREIWTWSDCNWTRTQNHLVLKRTLNHVANLVLGSSPVAVITLSYRYRYLKNVIHQIDSKNLWLLLSASFTAKYGLVFLLTMENAFS